MDQDLQVIILAAGKGKRMNSERPKVLCEVNGRPMILYLIDTLLKINLKNKPIAVVGYKAEDVKKTLGDRCDYALQTEQLGTGHAVASTREALKNFNGDILVLYGDMPLVSPETILKIFNVHQNNHSPLTMATAKVEDFNDWRAGFMAFGRILRDVNNKIIGIKEKADCSPEELNIREINPAYFCFNSDWLWKNIDKLQTDNKQGELYLTDLVEIAVDQNLDINSVEINPIECLGVNTDEQLSVVQEILVNTGTRFDLRSEASRMYRHTGKK
jgi:bifunctional UDP-N-acetylglucosamine pyrophosphorylase / glucosamine-1-phosphate N-acetyltransferase